MRYGITGLIIYRNEQGIVLMIPCSFFRFMVCDQCSDIYFEIVTQLANKPFIKSRVLVLAIPVEVGAGNVQIFADFCFGNLTLLQNFLYIKCQMSIVHNKSLFTEMNLLYIICSYFVIHTNVTNRSVIIKGSNNNE